MKEEKKTNDPKGSPSHSPPKSDTSQLKKKAQRYIVGIFIASNKRS